MQDREPINPESIWPSDATEGHSPAQTADLWDVSSENHDAALLLREPFADRIGTALLAATALAASFVLGWTGGARLPDGREAALMLGAALILPMVLQIALAIGQRSARAPVGIWFWADSRQQLSGLSLALMALLTLLPLDRFVPAAATTMQVVGDPEAVPAPVAEIIPIIEQAGSSLQSVERFDFYEMTRSCFAVLQTQEGRLYGNVILKKGVIPVG